MGDLPIKELGNKTPLEAATTPNLDRFAKDGVTGIMYVLGKGIRPNSDEAHLTLFGYDLKKDYPAVIEEINKEMHGMIAEGVPTTKAVYEYSKSHNLEMPLTHQAYEVLFRNKDIKKAIGDLLASI